MRQESGFTIVELLVTLAVAAILLAIAVPNFRQFILSTRISNAANEFALSVNIARSEAAKRGTAVYLGSISGDDDWGKDGWRVWVDDENNGTEGVYDDGVDEELHVSEPLGTEMEMTSDNAISRFRYFPSGRISQSDTLSLCSTGDGPSGRELSINAIGRLTVEANPCP